jgi:hypothetical protein
MSDVKAPTKRATKKATAKPAAARTRNTGSLGTSPIVTQQPEKTVDPLDIINSAGPMLKTQPKTDEDYDNQYNHIEGDSPTKEFIGDTESASLFSKQRQSSIPDLELEDDEVINSIPHIRKVVIKKINRFNFRLGMEKQPEQFNLVPGTSHGWVVGKKGDEFETGFKDFPDDRLRLERALGVDLGPKSSFWSNLSFDLNDSKHGTILNFDDPQIGPLHEVIYFAMRDPRCKLIANGLHEYTSGKKSAAEWFIENKEAEAEVRQENMTYDIEAMEAFQASSYGKRMGIAKMIGLAVHGVTEKVASVELWEHIKKSAENAKQFIEFANIKPEKFNVTILVKDAIKLNVIRKNKSNDYTYGAEVLGPTEEHIVSKLLNPSGASLRIGITNMLNAKK